MFSAQQKKWFITGTDTDAGKTVFATALLRACLHNGYTTAALKPIAAGGVSTDAGFFNQDSLLLQAAASQNNSYQQVNPYLFKQAIAPHIAAKNDNREILLDQCVECCSSVMDSDADVIVVEGAGGWLVPLNSQHNMADLAGALGCEIILVVGLKLGCINHALLTVAAVERSGLRLAGWVANHLSSDMPSYQENIATLQQRITAPLIAEIPFVQPIDPESLIVYINLPLLFKDQVL